MAGHSKFKNIQHRKGAQDKKRAKIFGRLIKELTVAARGGTDAASNPRLRTALAAARAGAGVELTWTATALPGDSSAGRSGRSR